MAVTLRMAAVPTPMLTSGHDSPHTLALSLIPRDGESLPGFLVRLAARGRHSDPRRLGLAVGLRFPGCAFDGSDLGLLADACGVPRSRLKEMAYPPGSRPNHHLFRSVEIHREQFDLLRRRVCPPCLVTSAHHRQLWDLTLSAVCPDHGVLLIGACPKCGSSLNWSMTDIDACGTCRAFLSQAQPQSVPREEAESARAMQSLASGEEVSWLPVSLSDIERGDLVRAAIMFGMLASGWQGQYRPETLAERGSEQVTKVVRAGIDVLRDWPASFHHLLSSKLPENGMRAAGRRSFGDIYDWMRELDDGALKDACRSAAQQYLREHPDLALRAHRSDLLDAPSVDFELVNLKQAASLLGSSATRVKRLAKAGVIALEHEHGRGIPSSVRAKSLEQLTARSGRLLNLDETAKRLGISKSNVRGLVAADILVPVHQAKAAGLGRWAFDERDLTGLMDRLDAHDVSDGSTELTAFTVAVTALGRRGVSMPQTLSLALRGELPVVGVNTSEVGLMRLRFAAQTLHEVCRRIEQDSGYVTLQAAAELLEVKWEVADHLNRIGLLPSSPEGVSVRAIHEFQARYVKGSELARSLGTSPRAVASRLAALGVKPVTGSGVDGGRQTFFVREEALRGVDRNFDKDG